MNSVQDAPASLAIGELLRAYRSGATTPLEVIEVLLARIDALNDRAIWISLVSRERLRAEALSLAARDPNSLPLYGIPFAIKDNIDLAGVPTTAACQEFAYTPASSAFVVARLVEAGAIPLGKTNLDQFATGLVGTRSPYGACRNSFDPEFIAGGSSSGSALAVALGLASFALGSDTAGSGRVPAAFNNLLGLKPTCGRLSPRGMVPACRTLDTVSILALDAEDAARVCRVSEGFDADEPYSRRAGPPWRELGAAPGGFRFGVPRPEQLQFFGNDEYRASFERAVMQLQRLGGQSVAIDFTPFREAAELLYEGPWLAERYIVLEPLLHRAPESIHPVTREIIERGARRSAADAFRAQYRLRALQRSAERVWESIDVLLTPTAGTIHRLREVEADPIRLNSQLGFYTNFVNLLDMAAVAVPAGFTRTGLPFGVTLVAPAWSDYELLALAARLQRASTTRAGALGAPLPADRGFDWQPSSERMALAVCGAHLQGLPLNHQLRERDAVLLARTRTAPCYRLYALPGGSPQRPGLVRVEGLGAAIEVEVWSLPSAAFGDFLATIPAPLVIGRLLLEDGREALGFLCEAHATAQAEDISAFGGWRAYLERR